MRELRRQMINKHQMKREDSYMAISSESNFNELTGVWHKRQSWFFNGRVYLETHYLANDGEDISREIRL